MRGTIGLDFSQLPIGDNTTSGYSKGQLRVCLSIATQADVTETVVIMFPEWQTFTGDNGGVSSLQVVKQNYQYKPNDNRLKTQIQDVCFKNTYEYLAGISTDFAPIGWTMKSYFIDTTKKRLSLDVERAFNTNVTGSTQVTLTPNSTYKVMLNWANYSLGACTSNTDNTCDWRNTYYKRNNIYPDQGFLNRKVRLAEANWAGATNNGDTYAQANTMLILNSATKLAAALTAAVALVF